MIISTPWESYFNRMRPNSYTQLLSTEEAYKLPSGTKIMIMFQSSGTSFEFEVLNTPQGKLLRNEYSVERIDAEPIFDRLGTGAPFHTAWKI